MMAVLNSRNMFGVNTPSSGSLQVVWTKVMNYKNDKINIVVCHYDKILVNVAAYIIRS